LIPELDETVCFPYKFLPVLREVMLRFILKYILNYSPVPAKISLLIAVPQQASI